MSRWPQTAAKTAKSKKKRATTKAFTGVGEVESIHAGVCVYIRKDSEAVLGVWLPAPLPTPRALPDHGALWPLAVGVEKHLGGIDV